MNQRQYIGIKQAEKTIKKAERRKRLGVERPGDAELIATAKSLLKQWKNEK